VRKTHTIVRSDPDAAAARRAQSEVDRKEYVMFKTVLWATDGSETAARALPYALGLAEPGKTKLVVAHAREIFVGRGGGYPLLADEGELREKIGRQVEEFRSGGFDATFIVRTCSAGHAARTIAEIAEEVGADLIVVGTHGYGRVAGLLIGSVTQGLLHEGVRPVLAIPTGTSVEAPERELETSTTK
jgi:nucleotide-binding universal stress UspA family protein